VGEGGGRGASQNAAPQPPARPRRHGGDRCGGTRRAARAAGGPYVLGLCSPQLGLLLRRAVRRRLQRWGLICPGRGFEPRLAVAELLLESSQALRCRGLQSIPGGGGDVASFYWERLPILVRGNRLRVADCLRIDLHLQGRMMVSAKLDSKELAPSEALILVWFHVILAGSGESFAQADPMSVAAEHEGISLRRGLLGFGRAWLRLAAAGSSAQGLGGGGHLDSVAGWGAVAELAGHSEFCDLAAKLRPHFLAAFGGCRTPSAATLFASSLLPSLDLSSAASSLGDPLWLDTSSPEFGRMAEVGQIARAALVHDFAQVPLTRRSYIQAVQIDRWLADVMDACIVE